MKKTNKVLKALTITICLGLVTLSASSCTTRPFEKRYERIHEITEAIDYTTAGDIIYEAYAPTGGYVTSAYMDVLYKSPDSYAILYERVSAIPGLECGEFDESRGTLCQGENGSLLRVSFGIVKNKDQAVDRWTETGYPYTYLNITDPSNGRKAE